MSFILDALRKAERDRNLGQAPRMQDVALAPEHAQADAISAPRQMVRIAVLVLTAVILVLLLVLLLRKPRGTANSPAATPTGVVTATVRGPAHTDSPKPTSITTAKDNSKPPAVSDDQDLSSLDDLSQTTPPKPDAANSGADEVNPTSVVREQEFVARPAASMAGTGTAGAGAGEVVASPPPPHPADTTPTASSDDAEASATPLNDMPQDYRDNFPALTVEVHVWDSDPAKRFVLINGKHYLEGETLASGPRLLAIAQDGLVLDFQGSHVLFSLN